MEPLLFDLNGVQNQQPNSIQVTAPVECPPKERICAKRRLDSHQDDLSPSPRKKRKCSTAPPDNTHLDAQRIQTHDKYATLSLTKKPPRSNAQSASPHATSKSLAIHPTVTILSSYDDSNIGDGHHSNVAISRNTKKQLSQSNNIDINTVKVENEGSQPPKKPVFSMTIQKKTNNIAPKAKTVSVFNLDGDATTDTTTGTTAAPLDTDTDIDMTVSNQNNEENHNPNGGHTQMPLPSTPASEAQPPPSSQGAPLTSDFIKEEREGAKDATMERIPKQNDEPSAPKEDSAESGEIVVVPHTKQSRLMRLLLDAKRVGGLIGKGGSAITKIRQNSHAKILIAKPIPHSLFRICSIEGEYEEIVCGINLVIDKMAEESTRLPPFQITVLVEEKNIGCLIGKKGNAITEIRNNTNANIYISSHLLRNSSEKTVDICGERDAVHCAIEMVIKRLCSNPSYVSTRMPYDPSMDFMQSPIKSMCEHPMNASGGGAAGGAGAAAYPYNPYHFPVNNPRLLNYALSNRFGALPSVQPQIISTSMSTPSLLTPLLSNTFSYRTPAHTPSFNLSQTSNPNLSKQSPSNSMISHVSNLQNTQNMPMHNNSFSNAKSNNNNNSRNGAAQHHSRNHVTHNNNNNNRNNVNNNNNNNNYIRSVLSHSNHNTQNNGVHPPSATANRYPQFQRVSPYAYSPRVIPPTQPQPGATINIAAAAAAAAGQTSVVFPIASHLIGGVIGRGGRNIQEIRRQTNAEIKIDNERQNKTKERYITINGTPQQISTAVHMIQNSLATHT